MPAPASATKLEDAISAYLAGEGCEIASRRHGVSADRLRSALVDRGLWRSREEQARLRAEATGRALLAKSRLPDEEIIERYERGETVNALAIAYRVSRRAIDYRLKSAGVPIRGSAEVNRAMAKARTPEENKRIMKAAQAATRGVPISMERKCKTAATREHRQTHVSEHERQLAQQLRERGLDVIAQKAIGPYNVDVATGTVAVEVFGGGWHAYGMHRKRTPDRLRYILDQGWTLVIVWASANRWPIGPGACDYIAALAQQASRDPSLSGQYRVIWGDGKDATIPGLDVDNLARIPSRSGRQSPRARDERTR